MYYFELFPTVNYNIKNNKALQAQAKREVLTNVMKRFTLSMNVDPKSTIFYEYLVEDGEKPWHVAYKFYDDPTLDWVILITNNIIDPHFGWALGYHDFVNYIKAKYGSVETAQRTILRYEQILQDRVVPNSSATDYSPVIPERKLIVDQTTYNSLPASSRRIVYAYDHEVSLNEIKRNIRILDSAYLQDFLEEAETILG